MLDWLEPYLDPETAALLGTGFGIMVGAAGLALKGMRKGKPTSSAAGDAIASASCRAGPEVTATLGKVLAEVEAIRAENRRMHEERESEARVARDWLVRLDERTKR